MTAQFQNSRLLSALAGIVFALLAFGCSAALANPPTERQPEFLESYKLADLKLRGVTIGADGDVALIEDPEGQVHLVKVGDHVGESQGRIERIFEDGLDLYEQVLNKDQKRVLRITRMYVETE